MEYSVSRFDADDALLIDRHRLAMVKQLTDATGVLDAVAEVQVDSARPKLSTVTGTGDCACVAEVRMRNEAVSTALFMRPLARTD